MVTIIETPGAPNANSYATMAEANTYFENRIPLPVSWVPSGELQAQALVTAGRYIDAMASPLTVFIPPTTTGGSRGYYRTRPTWTGKVTTVEQRLAWPRVGMFDRNGNPIATIDIPLDLKHAQCEFAGQLLVSDTTLNNDAIAQGISSVSAGSVSVSFSGMAIPRVWPDAVWNLLVPSWLTQEEISYVRAAQFEFMSTP